MKTQLWFCCLADSLDVPEFQLRKVTTNWSAGASFLPDIHGLAAPSLPKSETTVAEWPEKQSKIFSRIGCLRRESCGDVSTRIRQIAKFAKQLFCTFLMPFPPFGDKTWLVNFVSGVGNCLFASTDSRNQPHHADACKSKQKRFLAEASRHF